MQVKLDPASLGSLQSKGLAIGLARPSPSADVLSALAFSLAANRIVGSSFSISVDPQLRCFAAGGAFNSNQTVAPNLFSAPVDRSAIADTGITCTFDGTGIEVGTSRAVPGMLVMANASPGHDSDLTMGLAETFSNSADNREVEAPTLLTIVDSNTRWALSEPPAEAYLFTISQGVVPGTIIPPALYKPASNMRVARTSFIVSEGLLVDLSDEGLSVTYNLKTKTFTRG